MQKVFFITAGMLGGLVLWGTFTKDKLSSIGSLCGMALWGLVIAGLVNVFLGSSTLDRICSIAGVLVFTGLTMYDAKKVRELADAEYDLDGAAVHYCVSARKGYGRYPLSFVRPLKGSRGRWEACGSRSVE